MQDSEGWKGSAKDTEFHRLGIDKQMWATDHLVEMVKGEKMQQRSKRFPESLPMVMMMKRTTLHPR